MNTEETFRRHKRLVAEWDALEAQHDDLIDLHTWPGQLDPAALEQQLLNRMLKIEHELESLFCEITGGKLPNG